MAQPVWTFYAVDSAGEGLGELVDAKNRKMSWQLNGPTSVEFHLPLTSDAAALLTAGNVFVKAYRTAPGDDPTTDAQLKFYGPVWSVEQTAERSGIASHAVVAADPFVYLGKRFATDTYTNSDLGLIVKDLVDDANIAGETRIRTNTSNIGASFLGSPDWSQSSKPVSEVIREFGGQASGVDTWLVPIDDVASKCVDLYCSPQRGEEQEQAVFAYGPTTIANCLKMSKSVSFAEAANYVVGLGSVKQGIDGTLTATVSDATSIATYGLLIDEVSFTDVTDSTLLGYLATRYALTHLAGLTAVDFTPAPNVTRMFDDWDIGDYVRVHADHGAMQFDGLARVLAASLQIDENGRELVAGMTTELA